jgi:hypothetical protein
VSKTPERRTGDRRELVDLTRPAHLERRQQGRTRRASDEQRREEAVSALPEPAPLSRSDAAAERVEPSKPLAELEEDLAALQAAMDGRNELLKGLSEEDFQRSQVRHESVMIAWAVQVRRLEQEIAAARRAIPADEHDSSRAENS